MYIKTLYAIATFTHIVIAGPTAGPVKHLPPIGPPPPGFVPGESDHASGSDVKDDSNMQFKLNPGACPSAGACQRYNLGKNGDTDFFRSKKI
ncbi:hypothetical protein PspLS_04496 [Pyricularia sp. CBS 133598]|nr:hypothetical protein PspLS_04496 [Pyricularia sp. CBS 133598]